MTRGADARKRRRSTRRRSSARSSDARHAPDHISPPKNSSRPSSTRKKGTKSSDERPSAPRSSRSPGSKSCSAKTKASSDRAVAVGGVAAQAAQPAHVAERHRHVQAIEIGQHRAVAAGARHARPGFNRRRSGIAGEDAREQQPLRAVLEGEGQGDAVVGGVGRGADEADRAAGGQRDPLAAGGDAELGAGRDVQARPVTGLNRRCSASVRDASKPMTSSRLALPIDQTSLLLWCATNASPRAATIGGRSAARAAAAASRHDERARSWTDRSREVSFYGMVAAKILVDSIVMRRHCDAPWSTASYS